MRLAILSLSLVVSVSIARADESCFDKPLRKAWNGMARYLGICYSHGYHVCKSCGAQCVSPACSCGAQAFVEPGVITDEMNYVPVPMSQPAMVAPGAPAYMMHGHSIPDHYNEEIAKPERQYSPKPQVPTQVLQAPKPPIAREAPAVVRPAEPASPSDRANHAARDAMQLERAPAPEEVKPALPGPIASPSPTERRSDSVDSRIIADSIATERSRKYERR